MDSKSIARVLSKQHQKTSGIQTPEVKDLKFSSLSLQKPGKPELTAAEDLSKQKNIGEIYESKKFGVQFQKGSSVDSVSNKFGSGSSSSAPGKASGEAVRAVSGNIGSQESSIDQERKTSEYGSVKSSSVSAKASDGASSIAKTSGSAKISDRADFVESGKSSICRGSTSSDVSAPTSSSPSIQQFLESREFPVKPWRNWFQNLHSSFTSTSAFSTRSPFPNGSGGLDEIHCYFQSFMDCVVDCAS